MKAFALYTPSLVGARSLPELTRKGKPPTQNGHAPPSDESNKRGISIITNKQYINTTIVSHTLTMTQTETHTETHTDRITRTEKYTVTQKLEITKSH